ncbi:lkanal monooxygenase beta chain luxB [Candidatus Photodesmus katoptron]|uniref:bacterial luciferase n=1 Tax=Candidatus Photodesmus katoptron Akat1 TaxID=1236703 RepID=S3DJZ3_9GAMM|nr:LLM class flavin-dependent oxidoreductase [Candidatus Photodesmus katoptron]EPE37469.1 alkanal monooxygenase beta chain, bacterial luciferase beta subunit, LuxB [Candidatus Photodesmus katoptron Akat1]KEY90298.1 lkanal monooxygenase beta chain luxB [Candidatus Photodesmus katoptron]
MKFGLFFQNFLTKGQSSESILDNMMEIATHVDELNFKQISVYENHFSPNGIIGSPLTASGFLLGFTKKIKIGSLNHVLTTHHPVRSAEEACLLDQMSEGRFIFGFSDCEKISEMEFFNRQVDSQEQIFSACYDIVNEAFTTGYCHPDNDFYSFPKVSINPHAFTSGGPKQYVTASNMKVVKWAAMKALPLIFKWNDSNDTKSKYANYYKIIANEHGVDISNVEHQLTLMVNENIDSNLAKEEAREYLSDFVKEMHSDENYEAKLDELIDENAIGNFEECMISGKLALEKSGASHCLMSFESIQDIVRQKSVIDLVNENIGKYHHT